MLRTISKAELDSIINKHTKWLKNEEGGERADLRSADLRSADLRSADLSYANLSYADLRYADLRYANLRSADLSYADLRYADLSYANLRSADLSYADLRSADLSYANLSYADLRYANLIYFTFNQHTAYFVFDDKIRIGCKYQSIKRWISDYKTLGKTNGYSSDEIAAYGVFIKLCKSLQTKHDKRSKK